MPFRNAKLGPNLLVKSAGDGAREKGWGMKQAGGMVSGTEARSIQIKLDWSFSQSNS